MVNQSSLFSQIGFANLILISSPTGIFTNKEAILNLMTGKLLLGID